MTGIKIYDIDEDNDTDTEVTCSVSLTIGEETENLDNISVKYTAQNTPILDSLSTRFVSVLGGDEVTFTGQGFESGSLRFLSDEDSEFSVKIDGRTCTITSNDATSITCTSEDKPFGTGTIEP